MSGLTNHEASQRLAQFGLNEIKREKEISPWSIFFRQLNNPMIWLLFVACWIAFFLGEEIEAIAIGAIVILNSIVGFFQEYRAEKALLALRALTAPKARVIRDGHAAMIPALKIVPGDLLVVEPGDIIAADAKLLEAHSLSINEASLTGESLPVEKSIEEEVFLGTSVARGTGTAQVIETGMRTELGKIAHLLRGTQREPTPLQNHLKKVSQIFLYLCLGVVAVVAIIGYSQGRGWLEILLSSISLAVAAVPEGLPAIITIALALGVKRMAARHVLVRKLPAVETLGSVTVICTDKTGTLTTGVMTVREVWGADSKTTLFAAAACCEAGLAHDKQNGTGDPTEVAILIEAAKYGIDRELVEQELPRLEVHPFDSDRKRMTILRKNEVLYVKGAVESILPLCRGPIEEAHQTNSAMAERGLRVLAVATGVGAKEENLNLVGLIGITDPPRTEAIDSIAAAHQAGIKVVMITGDHPATARAIAEELGILDDDRRDSSELLHARASPQKKIDIVKYWKSRGETVAMTGDGVNDAPALKEAHIGIAMGKQGTEVAREASDMVLTDDNFASIIAAIQEGRGIYANIRKTMVYLLIGNTGEMGVMFVASLLGLPLPFLPIHLLWINLVTDGFPALALVIDPVSPDVLKQPPRNPSDPILGRKQWLQIAAIGTLEAFITLYSFNMELSRNGIIQARTFAFTVLVFSQMFRAFGARSATQVERRAGRYSNLPLLTVISATLLIQVSIHYFDFTRRIFQIAPLSLRQILLAIPLGLIAVMVIEISKRGFYRIRSTQSLD